MQTIEVRPSLIIGLGGTGYETALHLKARLIKKFGPSYNKVVKILVFDTDDTEKTVRDDTGNQIRLDRGVEWHHIGNVNVQTILQNIDKFPFVKEWLPSNLPATAVDRGAGQVRPIGRLAMFVHFDRVKSAIESALRDLRNLGLRGIIDSEYGLNVKLSNALNIFLISSTCGGTGSGIYLDIAYLSRYLASAAGIDAQRLYLTGMLALPLIYQHVNGDRIFPNAFANLKELDFFMGNDTEYRVNFNSSTEVYYNKQRPFNLCYLVDAANEDARQLRGIEQIAPMMAESIFLQFASQSGEATRSAFDNISSFTTSEDQGFVQSFSGLSTAEMVFPAEMIQEVCGARLLHNLLAKAFQNPNRPNKQALDQEIIRFNGLVSLSELQLIQQLEVNDKGVRLDMQITRPDRKVRVDQLYNRLQTIMNLTDNQVFPQKKEVILATSQHLLLKLKEQIDEHVRQLMNNDKFGPSYAQFFLEGLEEYLAQLDKRSSDNYTSRTAEHSGRIQQVQTAQTDLRKFRLGLFNHNQARTLAEKWVDAKNSELASRLETTIYAQVRTIIAELSTYVRKQIQNLRSFASNIDALVNRFKNLEQDTHRHYSPQRTPLVIQITNDKDIDSYYQQYTLSNPLALLSKMYTEAKQPSDWLNHDQDELFNRFQTFGNGVFHPITERTIESVINDANQHDAGYTNRKLSELLEISKPFWNIDPQRMSNFGSQLEESKIEVVGVYDRNNSIYNERNLQHGQQLVSLNDPHRITVLHTKHGLPLHAMRQYAQWEKSYTDHTERSRTPVHVYQFVNKDDVYALFELGRVFGYIYERGNAQFNFRPDPNNPAALETKLGQGMKQTLEFLISNQKMISQLTEIIDTQFEKDGAKLCLDKIDNHLRAPMTKKRDEDVQLRQALLAWRRANHGAFDFKQQ